MNDELIEFLVVSLLVIWSFGPIGLALTNTYYGFKYGFCRKVFLRTFFAGTVIGTNARLHAILWFLSLSCFVLLIPYYFIMINLSLTHPIFLIAGAAFAAFIGSQEIKNLKKMQRKKSKRI